MTRRDYELIAAVIRGQVQDAGHRGDKDAEHVLSDLAWKMGAMLGRDNERFQINRFIEACGLPVGGSK